DGSTGISLHIDAGVLSPAGTVMPESERQGGPLGDWMLTIIEPGKQQTSEQRTRDITELLSSLRARHVGDRTLTTTWAVYTHEVEYNAGWLGLALTTPGDTFLL